MLSSNTPFESPTASTRPLPANEPTHDITGATTRPPNPKLHPIRVKLRLQRSRVLATLTERADTTIDDMFLATITRPHKEKSAKRASPELSGTGRQAGSDQVPVVRAMSQLEDEPEWVRLDSPPSLSKDWVKIRPERRAEEAQETASSEQRKESQATASGMSPIASFLMLLGGDSVEGKTGGEEGNEADYEESDEEGEEDWVML